MMTGHIACDWNGCTNHLAFKIQSTVGHIDELSLTAVILIIGKNHYVSMTASVLMIMPAPVFCITAIFASVTGMMIVSTQNMDMCMYFLTREIIEKKNHLTAVAAGTGVNTETYIGQEVGQNQKPGCHICQELPHKRCKSKKLR